MNEILKTAMQDAVADEDHEAAAAMSVILKANGDRVTQNRIAESADWQRWAPARIFGIEKRSTAERRVRSAVKRARDLYGAPIMSCALGYFIETNPGAAKAQSMRITKEAKVRVVATLRTAKKLRGAYGIANSDPLVALLDEVVALSEMGREVEADTITGELRRMRLENDWLRARLAKWGRPPKRGKPGRGQQPLVGINP